MKIQDTTRGRGQSSAVHAPESFRRGHARVGGVGVCVWDLRKYPSFPPMMTTITPSRPSAAAEGGVDAAAVSSATSSTITTNNNNSNTSSIHHHHLWDVMQALKDQGQGVCGGGEME